MTTFATTFYGFFSKSTIDFLPAFFLVFFQKFLKFFSFLSQKFSGPKISPYAFLGVFFPKNIYKSKTRFSTTFSLLNVKLSKKILKFFSCLLSQKVSGPKIIFSSNLQFSQVFPNFLSKSTTFSPSFPLKIHDFACFFLVLSLVHSSLSYFLFPFSPWVPAPSSRGLNFEGNGT